MSIGRKNSPSKRAQRGLDELTGIATSQTWHSWVDNALQGGVARHLAVLVVDLDGFKQFNDILGHEQGDVILQGIARRLDLEIAKDGLAGVAARLEGDRFAVAVTGLPTPAELRSVAWRIRDALVQPIRVEGTTYLIGVSVGASVSPGHGRSALELLRGATAAMVEAKAAHAGVEVYVPGTPEGAASLELAADLLIAIDSERTSLVFQPQFADDGAEVVVVEALARWQTEDGNSVPPARFFPIAERYGLVRKLTLLTLRQALDAAKEWRDAGCAVPVSVNLSTAVLNDPTLPDQVWQLLDRRGLPASSLVVEVTEAAAVANREGVRQVLTQLREAGVRVDLDDFGCGYASFAAVRELPLDSLKIDRTLVAAHSGRAGKFLAAVVALAHSLDLRVVAEGIEDATTFEAVQLLGVDAVQGYHLAPPLQSRELIKMLRAQSGIFDDDLVADAEHSLTAGSGERLELTSGPHPHH